MKVRRVRKESATVLEGKVDLGNGHWLELGSTEQDLEEEQKEVFLSLVRHVHSS